MTLTWIHDQFVLYFVLKVYYPYIWAWAALLLLPAILLLPGHRRVTRVTLIALTVWHLPCLVLWGMFRQAPLAAWTLSAALSLRLAIMLWHLAPRGWFSTQVIQYYLSVDPRCIHLFDLARARRGLEIARLPQQRLSVRENCSGPGRFLLALMDRLTRIFARLPRFWRVPHRTLALDQPHVFDVLNDQTHHLEEIFIRLYHQTSLADYRELTPSRRVDHEDRIQSLAGRLIALIEATAEYLSFHRPMPLGHNEEKWKAYLSWARAWRFRRRYDGLWYGWETQEEAHGGRNAKVEDLVETQEPDSEDSNLDTDEQSPARADLLSPFAAAANATAAKSDDDAPTTTQTEADGASDTRLDAEEVPAPEPEAQPDEPTDAELIDMVASGAIEGAADEAAIEKSMSPELVTSDAARNVDVVEACVCLESELGLSSAESLDAGLRQARQKYADKRTRSEAFHLLVMYCARLDWTGPEADRTRMDVIDGMWHDFVGSGEKDRANSDSRRAAQSVLIDLLMSRREFARVRGFFAAAEKIERPTHELLAEACAGVARQIAAAGELRDMLLFEAIDHYFQAGHRGIWRKEIARRIIWEIRNQKDVLDLLDAFAVRAAPVMKVTLLAEPPSPPEPTTYGRLGVLQGDGTTWLEIRKLPSRVGHDKNCEIVVMKEGVSRAHCTIDRKDGRLVVWDNGSKFGTFVDGVAIGPKPVPLGTVLRLGKTDIAIETNSPRRPTARSVQQSQKL